jgi:hypothetical protein
MDIKKLADTAILTLLEPSVSLACIDPFIKIVKEFASHKQDSTHSFTQKFASSMFVANAFFATITS